MGREFEVVFCPANCSWMKSSRMALGAGGSPHALLDGVVINLQFVCCHFQRKGAGMSARNGELDLIRRPSICFQNPMKVSWPTVWRFLYDFLLLLPKLF